MIIKFTIGLPAALHFKQESASRSIAFLNCFLVAAVFAITAPMVMGGGLTGSESEKSRLEGHVASLNVAVEIYQNFGGRFEASATPAEVIAKLQRGADSLAGPESRRFAGSLVDRRLSVAMLSEGEETSLLPRVVWDGTVGRFSITTEPVGGVAQFFFEEAAAGELAGAGDEAESAAAEEQPGWSLR